MSKQGLETALKYGEKLKEFQSISDAEKYFFEYKDSLLNQFERTNGDGAFTFDYSIDSLKTLEKRYFELWEKDDFASFSVSREQFELMIGVYFNEVAVRNAGAKWEVKEFPFIRGKYELAVSLGLMTMAGLGHFIDLCTLKGNKKRNYIYREYKKYFES